MGNRDLEMEAALAEKLKWASFPYADSEGVVCQTGRHQGMQIPVSFMSITYEEDAEYFMIIHSCFPECNECRGIKLLDVVKDAKNAQN